MQDNVDYRLLERVRAKQNLTSQPPKAQADQPKRAAAATGSHRLPAIDLRD